MTVKAQTLDPNVQALVGSIQQLVRAQGVQEQGGWGFGNPYGGMSIGRRDVLEAQPGTQIYGQGLFSVCGENDIVNLLIRDEGFLRWLRWEANNDEVRPVKMLTWVGPEGTEAQEVTAGWMADECEPPNSVEWGKCEINFSKGLFGRCGQDISAISLGKKYCSAEPIYRLNGSVINNDAEWQVAIAGMVLRDDISEGLIVGNSGTAGQFDGLEQLIVEGYTDYRNGNPCSQVDSIVLDWNNEGVAGLPAVIAEIVARIRYRAKGVGGVNPSDMVIMVPSFLRDCLVDEYACEQPCGIGTAGNPITMIAVDARAARDRYLVGGQYGDGFVSVNGVPISFLVNDWIPFSSCPGGGADSYVSDIYILTRQVGPRRVIFGEYQDLRVSANALNQAFGGGHQVTDGGRFLVYSRKDETCFNTCLLTRPGLVISAPWAQARITNVCCGVDALTPLSPDPDSSYFLDFGNLYQAELPAPVAP